MKYRFFVCFIALEVVTLVFMAAAGNFTAGRMESLRHDNQQLVQVFDLTDLALWTGARYTRHVSQADVFSAFQDSMGALEHFPEGALAPLPAGMRLQTTAAHQKDRDEPAS